jgi:hypothetical protein
MKSTSLSMLAISLFASVFACSSTISSGGGGDPCSALAAKCPSCTLPNLAQTCNAAVASHDPASCQNGLNDHDIQTNCVSGSTASDDSGTDAPVSVIDSGSGGNDPGGGGSCLGGDVCVALCPAGNCTSCVSQSTCDATCAGHGCSQTCQGTGSCTFNCSGGGCQMACLGHASCTLECPGGGCTFDCGTTGTCHTSCSGGNCVGP